MTAMRRPVLLLATLIGVVVGLPKRPAGEYNYQPPDSPSQVYDTPSQSSDNGGQGEQNGESNSAHHSKPVEYKSAIQLNSEQAGTGDLGKTIARILYQLTDGALTSLEASHFPQPTLPEGGKIHFFMATDPGEGQTHTQHQKPDPIIIHPEERTHAFIAVSPYDIGEGDQVYSTLGLQQQETTSTHYVPLYIDSKYSSSQHTSLQGNSNAQTTSSLQQQKTSTNYVPLYTDSQDSSSRHTSLQGNSKAQTTYNTDPSNDQIQMKVLPLPSESSVGEQSLNFEHSGTEEQGGGNIEQGHVSSQDFSAGNSGDVQAGGNFAQGHASQHDFHAGNSGDIQGGDRFAQGHDSDQGFSPSNPGNVQDGDKFPQGHGSDQDFNVGNSGNVQGGGNFAHGHISHQEFNAGSSGNVQGGGNFVHGHISHQEFNAGSSGNIQSFGFQQRGSSKTSKSRTFGPNFGSHLEQSTSQGPTEQTPAATPAVQHAPAAQTFTPAQHAPPAAQTFTPAKQASPTIQTFAPTGQDTHVTLHTPAQSSIPAKPEVAPHPIVDHSTITPEHAISSASVATLSSSSANNNVQRFGNTGNNEGVPLPIGASVVPPVGTQQAQATTFDTRTQSPQVPSPAGAGNVAATPTATSGHPFSISSSTLQSTFNTQTDILSGPVFDNTLSLLQEPVFFDTFSPQDPALGNTLFTQDQGSPVFGVALPGLGQSQDVGGSTGVAVASHGSPGSNAINGVKGNGGANIGNGASSGSHITGVATGNEFQNTEDLGGSEFHSTGTAGGNGFHSTGASGGSELHSTGAGGGNGFHSTGAGRGNGFHSTSAGRGNGFHSIGAGRGNGFHSTGAGRGNGLHSTGASGGNGFHNTGAAGGNGFHSIGAGRGNGFHSTGAAGGNEFHSTGAGQGNGFHSTGVARGNGFQTNGAAGASGGQNNAVSSGRIHFQNTGVPLPTIGPQLPININQLPFNGNTHSTNNQLSFNANTNANQASGNANNPSNTKHNVNNDLGFAGTSVQNVGVPLTTIQ